MNIRKPVSLILTTTALASGAVLGLAGAASAATTTPAAHVRPMNNGGAYVYDTNTENYVAAVPAASCPGGDFCLYTDPVYQGSMFELSACDTYSLGGWSDTGSAYNAQSWYTAQTQFSNGGTDVSLDPGNGLLYWNSNPDYFAVPCT